MASNHTATAVTTMKFISRKCLLSSFDPVVAHTNSKLYQNAIQDKILNGNKRKIANVDVPVYLIGNSAYTLSTFLMKPFDYNITQLQDVKQYNYRVSRARIVTENAFG